MRFDYLAQPISEADLNRPEMILVQDQAPIVCQPDLPHNTNHLKHEIATRLSLRTH